MSEREGFRRDYAGRLWPTTIRGHEVPFNHLGMPDVSTIVGLATCITADCDRTDADARGWQDANNAVGSVNIDTSSLRRLIAAALPEVEAP